LPWRSSHRLLDSGSLSIFCVWRPQPIAFRELRVNEQIRIPQIRLFDDTTQEAFGIVPTERARQMALERELDLVEVAPTAQPPVCRLMDYGKYKFEALKKEKESRREHSIIRVKEMKLRPKISEHDFQTKFGYVKTFLREGDKVKLTIMFRGREMVHQEYGRKLLDRMAAELKDVAIVERAPLVEGRNMIMILNPVAKKHAKGEAHSEERAREPHPAGVVAQPPPLDDTDATAVPVATTPVTTTSTQPAPAGATHTGSTTSDAQDSHP